MPPSDSAGDSGQQSYYNGSDAPRPLSYSSSYPRPYLGLRARLSQIWINRWTILLLLVLVRVLMSIASMDGSVGDAREKALSACTKVESAGSALASMPYYMSKGLNELTATGVEKAVNGLMSMLDLTITGVQEIFVFYINMLTGTYVCLITLAVNGAIGAATKLVEEVTDFLNKALPEIGSGIQSVVGGFQDGLNKAAEKVQGLLPFIGGLPKLNVDDELKKLDDMQIPLDFLDSMKKVNESLPDFKEVQNFTDTVLRTPFQELKKLIKSEMDTYTFDRSLFPVPQKQQLDFCSEGNGLNDFFDSLVRLLYKGKKIFIGVIVVLAVLACLPMAYLEKKRFDREEATIRAFDKCATSGQHCIDSRDLVYTTARPNTAGFGLWITQRKSRTCPNSAHDPQPKPRQILIRWVIAYATSPPALFVLSLAIAGIFSCLCQYIMLRAIETQVPDLTDQVAQFTEKVTLALTDASESWQNGTNMAITSANDDINKKVFGWVGTSTDAVNDTLTAFVDKMSEGIDKVFGDTFLKDPIQGVINCLVVYKIEGIQKGLTWVHDNAHVSFPLVANDTFTLSALAEQTDSKSDDAFLLAPGNKTKDELTELVDKLIDKVESGILQEAAISAALLGVWLLLGIIGIVAACYQSFRSRGIPVFCDAYNQERLDAPRMVAVDELPSTFANPPPQYDMDESKESSHDSDHDPFHDQYQVKAEGAVNNLQPAHTQQDYRASSHGQLDNYNEKRGIYDADDDIRPYPQQARDSTPYQAYSSNQYRSQR